MRSNSQVHGDGPLLAAWASRTTLVPINTSLHLVSALHATVRSQNSAEGWGWNTPSYEHVTAATHTLIGKVQLHSCTAAQLNLLRFSGCSVRSSTSVSGFEN